MGFLKSLFKVLTFGLFSKVLDWLAPKPPGKQGIKIERQGSDQTVPVVYGLHEIGGIKVHKYVSDTPNEAWNDLLHLIVVFCEGEVDAIEEIFFDGISENDEKFDGGRLNGRWVSIERFTGTDNQPASAAAVSAIDNWTIDHKLSGLSYAYIVCQMPDQQSVWQGEPQITARIRGRKVYDPRTGLTEFSDNPALCLMDYLTNSRYGKGLPYSRLDEASFIATANLCGDLVTNTVTRREFVIDDTQAGRPVPVETTTTETVSKPLFTCNLFLDTGNTVFDNIKEILSTFRGIMPLSAGLISVQAETTGSPARVFDDENLVGAITIDSGGVNDRFNRVEVRFPNRLKNFETDSVFYPPDSDPNAAAWLAEDNGVRLERSFEFDGIIHKDEALQMAEVIAKRSRLNKSIKFKSQPIGLVVEPGDIVGVSSNTFGWTAKPFRVLTKTVRGDDTIDFEAIEHEDAIYPWSGATFDELIGGTWLGDPYDLAPVSGLSITPDLTLATTGTLVWTYTQNAFVRRYEVVITDSLGSIIYDQDVLGRSWTIPLLDVGDFTATVYAVSTVGYRSPSASIGFNISTPTAPTSLVTVAGDWQIEVRPQLSGIGLGTTFEHDIVIGDGSGHTPESVGRASSFTHTGLLPSTLYTVFSRTVNAYGVSAWVSQSITTTSTGAQVEPYLTSIRDELDAIELVVDMDGVWNPARDVAELVTSAFKDSERQEDARATIRIAQDAGLTAEGALQAVNVVEGQVNDPETGLSATFAAAQEAQITADGVAESSAALLSGVTGESDSAQALLKLDAYFNSGGLGSRAFLGTDVNNRVTGIVIDDSGVEQQILFLSNNVGFVDNAGQLKIYYNLVSERYVFDGDLVARSFTGRVVTANNIVANTITATEIATGAVTADELSATAIYGKRQVLTSGSLSWVTDPGNVELPSDIVVWAGNSGVSAGSRNRDNGLFWIDTSGQYSAPVNQTIKTGLATNNASTLSHKTVKGGCDLTVNAGVFSGIINNIQSINGSNHTLTVRIKRGSTTLSSVVIPVVLDGTPPNIVSAITEREFVLTALEDNTALPYFTTRTYTLEYLLNLDVTYTTPTTPVLAAEGSFRALEVRQLV